MSEDEDLPESRKRPVEEEAAAEMVTTHAVPEAAVATAAAAAAVAAAAAIEASPKPSKIAKTEKAYKGLRHFSMKVCKKVEEKGKTTYAEVADELVADSAHQRKDGKFDEKNIRRRVYDALNVLMAMDIIVKDKREITWRGLPTSAAQDIDMLEREVNYRRQEVERKREVLRELLIQQVCFKNLVDHNRQREAQGDMKPSDKKIPLPFVVVNTNSQAVIQCHMSRDFSDVMFDFSMPFEINDDNTILKRLGMHKTSMTILREMLPEDMLSYCERHGLLRQVLGEEAPDMSAPASTSDYQPQFTQSA